MNISFTGNARKNLGKLSNQTIKKFYKQAALLLSDPRHPSLRARKMGGSGSYEARIDRRYRFTYEIGKDQIFILTVGPHDEGLGKP